MSVIIMRRKNRWGLGREVRSYSALEISKGAPVGFFVRIRAKRGKATREFGCFASLDEALDKTDDIPKVEGGISATKRRGKKVRARAMRHLKGIVEKP